MENVTPKRSDYRHFLKEERDKSVEIWQKKPRKSVTGHIIFGPLEGRTSLLHYQTGSGVAFMVGLRLC